MSILVAKGGTDFYTTDIELIQYIQKTIDRIGINAKKILIIPPDFTRDMSQAGKITKFAYNLLKDKAHVDIMPALGTHAPMTENEIREMFGDEIPLTHFIVHNWRDDIVKVGTIPGKEIEEWSEGKVNFEINVEVNKHLFDGYDLILSVGQVLPHEVAGMANYTKNIMVGVGGADIINKSHFLGAVCNLENLLGKADNPVRRLFNTGLKRFFKTLPINYILTCIEQDPETNENIIRGFFSGNTDEVFYKAAELSRKINIRIIEQPIDKIVVYLDPDKFKNTWLANKAVYRTRMVIADGGELVIIAPGLKEFSKDKEIDKLIRKYGYAGTDKILEYVRKEKDLRQNLCAAAHLIHGSSEGRFKITYAPGHLTEKDIENVNFNYCSLKKAEEDYNLDKLHKGWNTLPNGEEIFFIDNPAAGLWTVKEKIYREK
ncbi:MAG: lactate racemase domain-containing protein [Victivallales bacterium]|nr:lactate racemase domain-containing protein [Victivallales bacterium]MCF7889424.1 lactate racemase domain-containing protein [Victivallales bacterium]